MKTAIISAGETDIRVVGVGLTEYAAEKARGTQRTDVTALWEQMDITVASQNQV